MSDKGDVVKRLVGIRCPKCNKEVDFLKHYSSGEMYYQFEVETNSLGHYEEQEFLPDNKVNDYECPYCSETLFTNEKKALKFLQGEISGKKKTWNKLS